LRVEGDGVVDRGGAEEAEAEKKDGPDVPEAPAVGVAREMAGGEVAETEQESRNKPGGNAVNARADGAEDVAAVELSGGQEIERGDKEADPGGAADWGEQKEVRVDAGMKGGVE